MEIHKYCLYHFNMKINDNQYMKIMNLPADKHNKARYASNSLTFSWKGNYLIMFCVVIYFRHSSTITM